MGKGDHNFYTEKGVKQPPTPPEQIGKGNHDCKQNTHKEVTVIFFALPTFLKKKETRTSRSFKVSN